MFTGIVTDIGELADAWESDADKSELTFRVNTSYIAKDIDIGASISHAGVCLTVTKAGQSDGQNWFEVQLSQETLSKTTLGTWQKGQRFNLERAARLGDEMGGHIVSGHVDGTGHVVSIEQIDGSWKMRFEVPAGLAPYIATKGSITVDGVSLTVNDVGPDWFEVNIIPHTQAVTTLGQLAPDAKVNLEIDMLARYMARYLEMKE